MALRSRAGAAGLPPAYARLHQAFAWDVPEFFNIAHACCGRWAADPEHAARTAIVCAGVGAAPDRPYCYGELHAQALRLTQLLHAQGVRAGDRVALVLPQCFETALAYMAVLHMGAIAVPLSLLFGPEALAFRLHDSGAVVALVDAQALDAVHALRAQCPGLRCVLGVGSVPGGSGSPADLHWAQALAGAPAQAPAVPAPVTRADDPAILIYTSGTTGNPKGALLPQRALLGNLSGFICSQNWFGFDGGANARSDAVFWSPADWAWTGGLMDALLPTLYFGCTIVAHAARFEPLAALQLMARCGVTHTFLFPTALKAMRRAAPGTAAAGRGSGTRRHAKCSVQRQYGLRLQALMSAGEALGDAVFAYCEQELGVTPNEMFGQTEINYIVGNCARLWPPKPGSMGMAYPGHRVAVLNEDGTECATDAIGEVALHRLDVHGAPDPIFFLGYWNNDAATRAKYRGDWCLTGDLARRDAQGYLWYQGRADDVFKSSGYRIGPGEIENCLLKHPDVANVAVVPKPDAERGALVKAYVVLSPDALARCAGNALALARLHAQLTQELQDQVRGQLAPYEYPKEIAYVDALPMTTTGKVQRRVLRLQEEKLALRKN